MISVLIPARNERFLAPTLRSLLKSAAGEIEILTVLDGYWPEELVEDPRVHYLHVAPARGMRQAINAAAAIARGDYLLKTDAHCLFGEGFDVILAAECADNWVVIPRRYSLDAENWCRREEKEPIDSMHYFWPYNHPDDLGLHGRPWLARGRERRDILLDEDVTFQGSAWFMHKNHWARIGPLSEVGYETFMGEPQEIGFKTQLGPWQGQVMVNKKTWYAHLHKGKQYGRMYSMSQAERVRGNAYSFDFWWHDRWPERAHDLAWLIEKFPPMPDWPADWQSYQHEKSRAF